MKADPLTTSANDSPLSAEPTNADLASMLGRVADQVDEIHGELVGRLRPLLTVEEVAALTRRTAHTVRRWIAQERIEATRVTGTGSRGRLLIPREELVKLLQAGLLRPFGGDFGHHVGGAPHRRHAGGQSARPPPAFQRKCILLVERILTIRQ